MRKISLPSKRGRKLNICRLSNIVSSFLTRTVTYKGCWSSSPLLTKDDSLEIDSGSISPTGSCTGRISFPRRGLEAVELPVETGLAVWFLKALNRATALRLFTAVEN